MRKKMISTILGAKRKKKEEALGKQKSRGNDWVLKKSRRSKFTCEIHKKLRLSLKTENIQ